MNLTSILFLELLKGLRWIHWVLAIVSILLSAAFITLFERKILGLTQNRLSPNKTIFKGILQPLLDALKLLTKPTVALNHFRASIYKLSTILAFIITLFLWYALPFRAWLETNFQVLWLLTLFGLGTYALLIRGWSSYSKYRLIGGWRRLSQAISYEVVLALLIMLPYLLNLTLNWNPLFNSQPTIFILIIWGLVLLIERQRAPFDLAEGESELVSGFNTEYGRLYFTLLFLREYGSILSLSLLSSLIWNGWSCLTIVWFSWWMFIRTCYPRVRYDKLIRLLWLIILPALIVLWVIFINLTLV